MISPIFQEISTGSVTNHSHLEILKFRNLDILCKLTHASHAHPMIDIDAAQYTAITPMYDQPVFPLNSHGLDCHVCSVSSSSGLTRFSSVSIRAFSLSLWTFSQSVRFSSSLFGSPARLFCCLVLYTSPPRSVRSRVALLGPALLGPALLGPALLGPALLGPALLGFALLGVALFGLALVGFDSIGI
ncbi:hypothetical protein QBC35DRAFT_105299 [Podospora australis]|uniref:Uncharacterized protein n=1 Tax=Podospora australis TaxID=1536484 RepID=A0AAN6X4B5_9PEZI|nr:hypothetical protein QBC35DRAFT_105299 [Podospora australis]